MFYTFSLLRFDMLLGKKLSDNEQILLDVMKYIKDIAGNALNEATEEDIEQIKNFKDTETLLSETEVNYVDFIFAISLFSIFVGRNKNVFDEKTEYQSIIICNLFFETLKAISVDQKDLLNKIENSVSFSYEFLKIHKLG